jgi:hypothetical protein
MNADERRFEPTRPITTRSLFTVVVEESDYVAARLRLSVAVVYLVAFATILWVWRAFAGGLGPIAGLVLLSLFAANSVKLFRRFRRDWRFRNLAIQDRCAHSPAQGQFAAEEITRVVVKKAAHDAASHLLVHIQSQPAPLLLFHSHSLPKVTALAQRLAERWRVQCTLPAPSVDLPAKRQVARIVGYVMLVAALVLGSHGGWKGFKQRAMLGWPTTLATVRQYDPRFEWCKEQGCYASPTIEYNYEVGGKTYSSCRLNPDAFHYQSKTQYAADLSGLQPGSVVTCWYNPADPAESYIVNSGVTGGTIFILVVDGLLMLAAVVAFRTLKQP